MRSNTATSFNILFGYLQDYLETVASKSNLGRSPCMLGETSTWKKVLD